MESVSNELVQRIKVLQTITIVWMALELCLALFAGIRAHSIALTAFGADSGIELLSALVVLRSFSIGPTAEKRAAQFCALLLYLLVLYIVVSVVFRVLHPDSVPESSAPGIVLLLVSAVLMPVLGRSKRKLAAQTCSASLRADSVQSNICAYMSWIALAGLLLTTFFHVVWADSIASLFLLPLLLKEAGEARKGELCDCC